MVGFGTSANCIWYIEKIVIRRWRTIKGKRTTWPEWASESRSAHALTPYLLIHRPETSSMTEPDLIEKPLDFILSPVIEQQSGRRSSNRLALNSLSRKSKDINGLQVGGKGHTTFVKLNLDDFVNESIANTFPKNSISPVTGDGKPNRVEEEGPARDDFGIIMSDNGVAMAIDTHGDREPEQIPQSDFEGMAVPAHVLNSGNHLLNPSSLNVCPMNTNVSAPPSPFKPVSGVFSPEGNGMGNIIVNDSSQSQVRPTVTKLNLIDANRSEPRKVPCDSVSPAHMANPLEEATANPDPFEINKKGNPTPNRLCKKIPKPAVVLAEKNAPISTFQESNVEQPQYSEENKNPDEEGFVMVSRKHRRPKVKILNNPNGHSKGKKVVIIKGPKVGGKHSVSVPRSSSEPIIQKKMGELHQQFEKSKMPNHRGLNDVTNSHKKPHQPKAPNRNPNPIFPPVSISQPNPSSSAQPNKSGKLVSAQQYQQKSPLPPAPRNDVSIIHTSNPFDVLDEDMLDANKSAGAVPDEEALGVGEKFYELSSDSIAKVLNFNPSKLTVPRIHDLPQDQDDPDFIDEMCEEEIPDFNITNAQKQAICNSLTRFGAVKADDQANWEQGEWEFFHYQMKILNIDPETSIEDVDSDSNETAQFFKSQMQQGAPGRSVSQAHHQAKKV
ncbi:hypothetical protein L1987_61373 [Smallanthus sonchifolius]|uniref:Uncharacterized protein n=1 Tax=Smallanthus sonchifolius TaxID=185202 RepID=A0ACB9DAP4_9ASTR|nr:hypothetical protein L1987_61373 [Smallanthus sonchifolius]